MMSSYLMIDPFGRFFDNTQSIQETGYSYSSLILDIGVEQALKQIYFNFEKFIKRYSHSEQ